MLIEEANHLCKQLKLCSATLFHIKRCLSSAAESMSKRFLKKECVTLCELTGLTIREGKGGGDTHASLVLA